MDSEISDILRSSRPEIANEVAKKSAKGGAVQGGVGSEEDSFLVIDEEGGLEECKEKERQHGSDEGEVSGMELGFEQSLESIFL